MNNQTLIKYWKHLNYTEMVMNGLDRQSAFEMASEATYEPIDINFCIVTGDEITVFLRATNGVIYSSDEMPRF